MAKEDFCFTYYDGDAARDKAHMNRLERGAYDDLISAQRKFGHLSKPLIEKILSGDFEKCWGALEIILKKDDEGKFFIEWLEKSLFKRKYHSQKQKERVEKRWYQSGNTEMQSGINPVIPKAYLKENGDGNEDGYEYKIENENFDSVKTFTADEELLGQYEKWGAMITDHADQFFQTELYNSGVDAVEVTRDRMTQYLGLLNTYPRKRPQNQQSFRKSFLGYVIEQKQSGKNGNFTKGSNGKVFRNKDYSEKF